MIHEIGKNFFTIRSTEEDFHRNIYLKQFVAANGQAINMLFDPGTKLDLAAMLPMLKEKAGGINKMSLIFLSHQDPDLTANIATVMTSAPQAFLLTSLDTWRLVKMYGLPEKRMRTIESFDSYILRFRKSGHRVRFVPARYCHFRGSMMLYDYESRVLFSGDFMGGVNSRKGKGIYANEDSWEGIKLFHQLYMPSTRAVRKTVERILMINPLPEVIAPQHGDVIKGGLVREFLERLANLQVGIDLIDDNAPEIDLVVLGINHFLELLEINSPETHKVFLERFQKTNNFATPFTFSMGKVTGIKIAADTALLQLYSFIGEIAEGENYQRLKGMLVNTLAQLDVHVQIYDEEVKDAAGTGSNIVMSLEEMLE